MQTQNTTAQVESLDEILSDLYRTAGLSSQVADLVREVYAAAEANGLHLSRWQANKGNYQTTITYMLHTGPRREQARYQPEDSIVAIERLHAVEGSTTRCAAGRALTRLLAVAQAHNVAMAVDGEGYQVWCHRSSGEQFLARLNSDGSALVAGPFSADELATDLDDLWHNQTVSDTWSVAADDATYILAAR